MLSAKPASTKVNLRLRQDQDDRRDWQWWFRFPAEGLAMVARVPAEVRWCG